MPRTVPAGITAKQNNTPGAGVSLLWLFLVEIHFKSGASVYYSSGQAASFGGNNYVANKVTEVSGLTAQYIDRKRRDFGAITITLDNLAEGGSSAFPVTVLEGSLDPAEGRVFVHLFDAFSGAGVDAIWQGYVKDRQYDSDNYTCTVNASFLWDSPGIVIPSSTLQQNGFAELDSNSNKENLAGDTALPLYWGAGPIKIRPTIWHTRVRDSEIQINGIISGTGPTPFNAGDVTAANMKLFDITKASRVDFRIGAAADTAPPDRTAFPDGLAHNNVAHFSARFPITDDNKSKLDNISADDVRMTIANGRPLIGTGLPSGNGILIMQDGLRDVSAGLGMPGTDFDDLTAAAAAAGSRWQCRVEMHEQVSVGDWIQNFCAQLAGFVTFNGRKCQLGIKLPTETPIATFATLKSGQSGRRVNGKVRQWFEAADQAKNQVNIKYRLTNRHEKELIAYDENAQARAGGTIRKVEKDDLTFDALYQAAPTDTGQVAISAATIIREEQNLNMMIEVKAPLAESLDVAPGDLIRCWSENISNNGTNNVFRIIGQTFEGGADPQAVMTCQVYFAAVYNYNTGGISVDLIHGGSNIGSTGRPPDVENVALALVEKVTHDTEGNEAHIRGSWTWPAVDLAGDATAGVVREYPIKSVLMKWRFADEGVNEWKPGKEVQYPTAFGDFNVPYLKSKTVQVEFIALSLGGSQGVDGYVADPTKTVLLEGDWNGTACAFFCSSPTGIIAIGDYIKTEFEINHVADLVDFGGGHGQINVDPNSLAPRTAFFDSVPIAHPSGTQVARAKQNYPVAQLSLSPARFNYPAVTQVALHQRALAVKFVIGDVNTQNLEDYATYWTIFPFAATDPAKLGSASPAWMLADPLSPPAGVNIILGPELHFELPQESIGPAGTRVWARVAARNGKHNWSGDGAGNPQLSPLVNNAPGDDAIPIANAPRVPIKKRGIVVVEPMPTINVKTLSKMEAVIQARNAADQILGYLTDSTGDYTSSFPNEYRFDMQMSNRLPLPIGQDTVLAIWPTASKLKIAVYLTNAVGTSLISPFATIDVATWETLNEGAVVPGLLQFPTVFVATPNVSSLSINTVDGDPDKGMARIVFDIYTANLLGLDANNVDAVAFSLIERNADNTADVGKRFSQELTLGVSSFNTFGRSLYLPIGRHFRLLEVISINGDKRAVATGILDFISGGVITVAPGDAKIVPAPTFVSQPVANGRKDADFTIRLAQNGTDIILFKTLLVEVSFGGGAYKTQSLSYLKALDDLHSSANPAIGFHDFPITCHRKPGVTLDVRATVRAIGGKLSAVANATQLAASADDVPTDTGFPNNAAAITITRAALKNGRTLIVHIVTPTAQMATHITNYLIIHDANQTGAGQKVFDPVSQTWVTSYADGTTQMDIGKGGVDGLNCPLSALIVGGRTRISVVIGVKNAFNGGSTQYSNLSPGIGTIGNIDLSTGGAEPVDLDAAVPDVSALQGVFRYSGGKEAIFECPLPTANMNTFTKVDLSIQITDILANQLGYLSRNSTGQFILSPTEVFFNLGRQNAFGLNVKKVDLKALAPTAYRLTFVYYVWNGKGRSATHDIGRNVFIDLDIIDYLGARSVPVMIDVAASMYSMNNVLDNGEFDKNDAGTTTNLLNWYRWNGGNLNTGTAVGIRLGSPGIIWTPTQDNVAILAPGDYFLVRPIGQLLKPGVNYSLSCVLRAAINGFSPIVKAWIVKEGSINSAGANGANLNAANLLAQPFQLSAGTALSSSAYLTAGNYQKCPVTTSLGNGGTPNIYPNLWLVIGVPAGFPASNQLIIDRVKLTPSAQPSSFSTASGEVPGVVDIGGTGIIPGNVGNLPDAAYLPSGDQGGYTATGGVFV